VPKRVYVVSNIPLDGLEIDELITWREMAGDPRLNQALDVCALRDNAALLLSADRLATSFPELWRNAKAVENWLAEPYVADRIKKSANPIFPNRSVVLAEGGFHTAKPGEPLVADWRLVSFRPSNRRGGRPSRALVRFDADPAEALATVWGATRQTSRSSKTLGGAFRTSRSNCLSRTALHEAFRAWLDANFVTLPMRPQPQRS